MGEIPLSLLTSAGGEGAEVVYSLRNNDKFANMILDNIGNAGQKKRKVYQRRLPENPSKDYYYIMRLTDPLESVLIEYGFIDNKNDAFKLQNNLEDYAEGVVKAIADYAGVEYRIPGSIPEDSNIYIVKAGDTLYSIARKYGKTVDELKELNNLTSNTLMIGQQLIINDDYSNNNDEYIEYIVQRGDSLYSIAKRFGISVDLLKDINGLSSNLIGIGQMLFIPGNSNNIEYVYIVKRGDSLWKIAQDNNITVDDIINRNGLTSTILSIGQQLIIPKN